VTGGTRGHDAHRHEERRRPGREGEDLALHAPADVAPVVGSLREHGGEVHYVRADVGDAADRARLVDDVHARFGAVNALVNNAGRAPSVRADILDAGEDSFDALIRTNLRGPYFLTQAIARAQLARRQQEPAFRASIVFITSVSAEMASTNRGDYCVSKAGLAMAVKLFSSRLAADGIPVYEVRPGIIATDMTAAVQEVYTRRIADGLVPERRWGEADDVGRVVAALVRGDLPYATGSVINVDGGMSVQRL